MTAHATPQAPAASEPHVLREVREHVGVLTLNRPDKLNILTAEMIAALDEALEAMRQARSVRVIVVAGSGRAFCAGHDFRALVDRPEEEIAALFKASAHMMEAMRRNPKPVIAQVNGPAVAAGCQLVASCDLAVASQAAQFGTTGVRYGLFCSAPMVPLSRVVPPRKALELLLTGDTIPADEADRIGLVNRVVAPEELAAATMELAARITRHSGYVVQLGKGVFYEQIEKDYDEAYAIGCGAMARNAVAPDGQEGMRAFVEKRAPNYSD